MMRSWAALGVASAFGALAVLHGYWALGGFWPGRDSESLARMVVGSPPGTRAPGPGPCWCVVMLLLAGMALVSGAAGFLSLPLAPHWIQRGTLLVAIILLLRGLLGLAYSIIRRKADSPFVKLNIILYSPLCLLLSLLLCMAMEH
ncbi:DUF3995 domain-containing protein [Megalodesulfovibrio gigas]|uniref:DUF3995 domain-containing protein n=1 Tax=Megalodesulfovibrio gigas (strain ATCC 19364 / DSM 1382 / NCIMB 9332 / VKM B-1759) TaxID=1121448 RepID=T2GBH4_MEGG1|nr:DUF3995 domain-containing protein [Megalodesulfovibrio gigas]AGW13481.1 hypothetical protein DGI_1658 [Megalodesulfovibrio gigas DSM 1382 = ATCC 19364]